ncbi:MAG: hypothetical protein ACJA2S_004202 [Cyclobacteriaceae bacterium]|jgi:hypothetical protein
MPFGTRFIAGTLWCIKNNMMREILIMIAVAILFSCSNDSRNISEVIDEETLQTDTSDVFGKLQYNLVVTPDLRDFDFIRFDTIYKFSVKNVPGEYIGAQINRGRITKTGPLDFEFFVHPPKDSVEIKIFAQIEGAREYLYVVKKKLKK